MILVNLLPKELRVKEGKKINIAYRPIAFCIFSIFLVAALYNLFLFIRIREEYRKLDKQWNSMAEKSTQADLLERELGATILAEVDFYDTFVDPSPEIAKVLNLISDLIPKSVWLTQLKFERNKKELQLVLNGLSESSGKDLRLVEIQNFVNQLKDQIEQFIGPASAVNPNAKRRLKVAVTTSSQKSEDENTEVALFAATLKTDGFTPQGGSWKN